MKKSQVTLFIILGLIIVLTVAVVLVAKNMAEKEIVEKQLVKDYTLKNDITPVKMYVEECLAAISKKPVMDIAQAGGTFNAKQFKYYKGSKVNFLCYQQDNMGCVNTYLTKQDIEKEIEDEIKKEFAKCTDLKIFENQGFKITYGEMDVVADIGKYETSINVKEPIRLEKGDSELAIDSFKTTVKAPLGLLYDTAVKIMNDESANGYFDQTKHMLFDKDSIIIEKRKPYPDIVYTLSKDNFVFNFAIQGKDTVSDVGYSYFGEIDNEYGCCVNPYDNNCFKNTPPDICSLKKGIYDPSKECKCEQPESNELQTKCNGKECLDCSNTYNYLSGRLDNKKRSHGESWCSYEGVVGNGKDLVGSRHYAHYCYDGKEYAEECRDYREEICVEDNGKAICRPNRWQDCIGCKDELCCNDAEYRDCVWYPSNAAIKCFPNVPPGFKFWGYNALAVCIKGNEKKDCDGFSCEQNWLDDTAVACTMQGDCGNYMNYKGEFTKQGYFETDMKKKPNYNLLNDDDYTKKGNTAKIALPFGKTKRAELEPYSYKGAFNANAEFVTAAMDYVDDITSISMSDFLNPFRGKSPIHVLDITFCLPWAAPWNNNCDECKNDNFRQCSEYKCKSLGQGCIFDYNKGSPTCEFRSKGDKYGPIIEIDNASITPGYKVEKKELMLSGNKVNGYIVTPPIKQNKPFTFSIKTDEESICKFDLVPVKKFEDLPAMYIGDPIYSTTHTVTLRMPPKVAFSQKLLDILDVQTVDQVIDFIEKPEEILRTYKEKYKTALSLYELFTGDDLTEKIDPVVKRVIGYLDMIHKQVPFAKALIRYILDGMQNGRYTFFMRCTDMAGNENQDIPFLEFVIDDNADDKEAPAIIAAYPENGAKLALDKVSNDVSIYTDEFAECRYDFSDKSYNEMSNNFKCANSIYDLSAVEGGTYECMANLLVSKKTFIKCRDNPYKTESYKLNIIKSDKTALSGIPMSEYINISYPNTITFSLKMLSEDINFYLAADTANVVMHMEDLDKCYVELPDENKSISCSRNDQLHLGLYKCSFDLSLAKQSSEGKKIILTFMINNNSNNLAGIEVNEGIMNANYSMIVSELYVNTNKSSMQLNIKFNESNTCKINDEDMQCSGIVCSSSVSTNEQYTIACKKSELNNKFSYNIVCAPPNKKKQNVNQESYVYYLDASSGLSITATSPINEITTRNPIISVRTTPSEGIKCKFRDINSFSYVAMFKSPDNVFEYSLKDLPYGDNIFEIVCTDIYGNSDVKNVEFFILEMK